MRTDTATMVPPRRLGALLRQARVAAGTELDALATEQLTVVDLDDIEHGRRLVDDRLLEQLVLLYGVQDAGLLPDRARLVIDLDEGRIAIDGNDVDADEVAGPDAVLARYLALVYHLRDLPIGTPIQLRDLDLEVLSGALALEPEDVTQRLTRLMESEDAVARDQNRIRRRLLLPLVGVVIAAVSGGALLLVAEPPNDPDSDTTAQLDTELSLATTDTAVVTDIGPGGAVATNDGVATQLGTPAVEINDTD